ncbi:YhgE/Pip domain-containing protein [Glycomyces albus]
MSPFKLSILELRRFRGHPVRVAALIAVVLIPLVYGGLYLWFAWDPYGKTGDIPVAVVNADEGATYEDDGERTEVNGGDQLVQQLESTDLLDWNFTDADTARTGLEDGDYYFVITIPEDFSEKLVSLAGESPERAEVEFDLNDANGYIASIMAETVELQLQQQINTAVYVTFAETIFGDLSELGDGLTEAADGASELSDGVGEARSGAEDLESGLVDLHSGAQEVADGADQVSDGVDQVVDAAQPVVDDLAGDWDQIQAGAEAGAGLVDRAATDLDAVYDELCGDDPDGDACLALESVVDEADQVNTDVQNGNDAVQGVTGSRLEAASDDLADLQTGAADVAEGADQLVDGAAAAQTGAGDLADGLGQLQDGADTLASSLSEAAEQVPAGDPTKDAENADVYGSPVAIDEDNLNPAGTYGRGLSPFFIAVALWVFGLIAYLVLRPVNPRAAAGPLRSPLIAVGGWMPGALLGLLAAVVLYAVLDIGLGLDPLHTASTIGFCLLAILAFSAMTHLLKLAFGAAGSLLIVVLLMLQLTSAGGLYPPETTPGFFQALHPLLPMTYVVDGLRVTVSGGQTEHLLRALVVLACWLVASLVVSSLVVALRRKWNADRLHEPLKI